MSKRLLASVVAAAFLGSAGLAFGNESDELPLTALTKARPHNGGGRLAPLHAAQAAMRRNGIPGIDSILNFNGSYRAAGVDATGLPSDFWQYNMIGRAPNHGDTTEFNAPLIPVSLDLRNADGSPRFVNGQRLFSDATQFVTPVLNSPVFRKARYSSSERPTQFSDAVFRAQFWRGAGEHGDDRDDRLSEDWHTVLEPSVKSPQVMTLIQGSYQFALNADGSCCAFVLVDINAFANALLPATFPVDSSTPVGAAEVAGDMTTKDITTLLFPNTYLTDPSGGCCVIGFHTYDLEPGDASNGNRERRYVLNYSSWVSPGLFSGGLQDVGALSHEVSEIYSDPFVASDGVHNVTPFWLSPNGLCQNNLESGDVVEGLPNAFFPVTVDGVTYHPQNEALLPWFEFQSPSTAIHGAYSYPDETVLTALSPPQRALCQ